MVSKGHYICGICHRYIRPKIQGKTTGQKIVNYLLKIWKNSVTGNYYEYYTKAHKKCLNNIREKEKRLINWVKGGDK